MSIRAVSLFVTALITLFSLISLPFGAPAQDMSLIGKMCPTDLATYPPIDGNARCDPALRNSKACDQNYERPSVSWHACYKKIEDCRTEAFETNSKISKYNAWVSKCQQTFRNRSTSNQPPSTTTRSSPQPGTGNTTTSTTTPKSNQSELSRLRDAAKKKADGADVQNTTAREQLPTLKRNYEEEKIKELEEEVRKNQEKTQRQIENERRAAPNQCSIVQRN